MARRGNGSSAYIASGALGSLPANYSFHFWYRNTVEAPNTAAYRIPVQLGDSSAIAIGFIWSHLSSGYTQSAYHGDVSSGFPNAQLTSTLTTNTWYAIGASYDGTDLRVWLNGVNEASSPAAAVLDVGVENIYALGSAAGSPDYGDMAQYAWWNVALAPGEFQSLAAGIDPIYVRPASLLLSWPLYGTASPEPDWSGNVRNGTLTGTTGVDHAPTPPLVLSTPGLPYAVTAEPQQALPNADVSVGGWTASTGSDLYAMIDETTASDADYIQSATTPSSDVAEVALTNPADPAVSTGHIIRIRARKPS